MRIGWILGLAAGCLASFTATAVQERRETPDYWKCLHRVSGSWTFGQAPSGCDGASFGDDRIVQSKYGPLVFRDGAQGEASRYLEEMHAVIRDAAAHYIRRRKPRASPIEVVVFRRAVLALAHQESYWTHYRLAPDRRLKMMRGDLGHGHGMMQIDDRFHFVKIQAGEAWDLTGNLAYALELYYAQWERAVQASCLGRADDYESRSRAAYSAYNGGAGQICRWTNPAHKWARNDKGFHQKFLGQTWVPYIPDLKKPAAFDIGCELDGGANCLLPGTGVSPAAPYRAFANGREIGVCVDGESGAQCVADARDLACLPLAAEGALGFELGADRDLGAELEPDGPFRALDRHELCSRSGLWLHSVGTWLRLQTNINLRSTAGGGRLGVVLSGELAQVLDFEIRADPGLTRYYRVKTAAGRMGWIFAGEATTQMKYVDVGEVQPGGLIPLSRARIHAAHGINVRNTPGGEKVGWVAKGALVAVADVIVRGGNNETYLKISGDGGTEGFVYAGRLLPEATTGLWVKSEDGIEDGR